jgi:hypothetical protein
LEDRGDGNERPNAEVNLNSNQLTCYPLKPGYFSGSIKIEKGSSRQLKAFTTIQMWVVACGKKPFSDIIEGIREQFKLTKNAFFGQNSRIYKISSIVCSYLASYSHIFVAI